MKIYEVEKETLSFPTSPVSLPRTFVHSSNQVDSKTNVISNVIQNYSKPERIAATPKGADDKEI
jgi:hypothetical protein